MTRRYFLITILVLISAFAVFYFFSGPLWNQTPNTSLESDWNQIGNLVYNNPGLKPNTWYLVYEQPGQPGLYKELKFDSASACAINAPAAECNPSTIPVGAHVRVEGKIVGTNTVLVRTIQLPEAFGQMPTVSSTTSSATTTGKTGTASTTLPATGNATSSASSTNPLQAPVSVKLYLYNPSLDISSNATTSSSTVQCSATGLVAVTRSIPQTNTPLQDTIKLLLRGDLTSKEKASGFLSEFPLSGLTLLSANNDEGKLTLTFRDPKNSTSGGSCRTAIMWNQIKATAKQFPGVETVEYAPPYLFQP